MMRMPILVLAAAAMTACAADAPPRPSAPATAKAEAKESRPVTLKNPGFENAARKSELCPEGWHCTMHSNPESFVFRVETPEGAQGKQALCIERVLPEPWALVTQAVPAAALKGEKLRFSVALRVDRADGGGAGAWAVVHGPRGTWPTRNACSRRPAAGSGWRWTSRSLPRRSWSRWGQRCRVGTSLLRRGAPGNPRAVGSL
jgi:hypothetical protein